MGTSLILITDSDLTGKETQKDWERIVDELEQLQLDTISYVNAKNEIIKEHGNWSFEIEEEGNYPFNVNFVGPFPILPTLYSNIGLIYTIYRYNLLYENHSLDWFESFRNDLYNIVKIIGGTEVIYLADNACDKLSIFSEGMAVENAPYEDIKAKMLQEFGQAVKDYSKLYYDKLSYQKIDEFFLDDFSDLKMKDKNQKH